MNGEAEEEETGRSRGMERAVITGGYGLAVVALRNIM